MNWRKEREEAIEESDVDRQKTLEKNILDVRKKVKWYSYVCTQCFQDRRFLSEQDARIVKDLRKKGLTDEEKEQLREELDGMDYTLLIPRDKALNYQEVLFIKRIIIRLAEYSENPLQQYSVPSLLENSSFHFAMPCFGCYERAEDGITPICEKSRTQNGFYGLRYIGIRKEEEWPSRIRNYCNSCFYLHGKKSWQHYFFLLKFSPQIRSFNKMPAPSIIRPILSQNDDSVEDNIPVPQTSIFEVLREQSYFLNYKQDTGQKSMRQILMESSQKMSSQIQDLRESAYKSMANGVSRTERKLVADQEKKQPKQTQMLIRHSQPLRPRFSFVNSFFQNAYVVQNKHDISRQFTLIQNPPDTFSVNLFIRSTLQEIDRVLLMHHPNILRIKGFLIATSAHSNSNEFLGPILSKKYEDDEKWVTYFAERMITTLDRLLEQRKTDRRFEGTYLELQFPLFWRVRAAIKIMAAVHFLHERNIVFKERTLRSGLVFFDENGEVFIPPPLILATESRQLHKVKNVSECGRIIHQLITGLRDSPNKCQFFTRQIDAVRQFEGPAKNGTVVLQEAITAMKIACEGFHQFLKTNEPLAEEIIQSKNFMSEMTNASLVRKLDRSFEKIYRGLVKFKLI